VENLEDPSSFGCEKVEEDAPTNEALHRAVVIR
jgi:hypothetical protein